jgi:hypothetical protein
MTVDDAADSLGISVGRFHSVITQLRNKGVEIPSVVEEGRGNRPDCFSYAEFLPVLDSTA